MGLELKIDLKVTISNTWGQRPQGLHIRPTKTTSCPRISPQFAQVTIKTSNYPANMLEFVQNSAICIHSCKILLNLCVNEHNRVDLFSFSLKLCLIV